MSIIPQLVVNSIIAGSIYALVALGFNLIYGTTKFFNLAHGIVAAIGGYIVLFLTQSWHLNLYLSILIGVLGAGGVGLLLEKCIYLPLRKKKASNMILLVASLGAFTALQAFVAILFTSQFQILSSFYSQRVFQIFGGTITQVQLVILGSGILILIALGLLLKRTMFGRAVQAISDDEEVSKIIGIDTNKVIAKVFFIGSMIAGLSGIFVGLDTGIEPTMGLNLLLKGIIAAIVGGIGNIYGGFLGAFLLGLAENFGIWKISGEWKDSIAFIVLILFLIFRPKGILGR